MRLLDAVVQDRSHIEAPLAGAGGVVRLPSARDCAAALHGCPLRWVLSDEVTRYCTAFAYSAGAQLARCLDLLRIPAQTLWLEWLDTPRSGVLRELTDIPRPDDPPARTHRAGLLVRCDASGRRGDYRVLWTERDAPETPCLAPIIVSFRLDDPFDPDDSAPSGPLDEGGWLGLGYAQDPALDGLLRHFRLSFDPAWARFYRQSSLSPAGRTELVRRSVATVASDIPMLLSVLLLANARDGLQQCLVDMHRLNRARARAGRALLMDHVEVRMPLPTVSTTSVPAADSPSVGRRARRLHHVRGHLVRRGQTIYWRMPHLRGRADIGMIRARTVTLTFEPTVMSRHRETAAAVLASG